jgi:hypothetical protein
MADFSALLDIDPDADTGAMMAGVIACRVFRDRDKNELLALAQLCDKDEACANEMYLALTAFLKERQQ